MKFTTLPITPDPHQQDRDTITQTLNDLADIYEPRSAALIHQIDVAQSHRQPYRHLQDQLAVLRDEYYHARTIILKPLIEIERSRPHVLLVTAETPEEEQALMRLVEIGKDMRCQKS